MGIDITGRVREALHVRREKRKRKLVKYKRVERTFMEKEHGVCQALLFP